MQFERESRPAFLEVGTTPVRQELIPVVPEEDEVSLVVECHHFAPVEVRFLGEEARKHSAHSVSHLCVEVVQDQLGVVVRGVSVVGDLVPQLNARYSVGGGGSLGQVAVNEGVRGSRLFVDQQEVGEVLLLRPLDHVLYLELLPLVVVQFREHLLQGLQEREHEL